MDSKLRTTAILSSLAAILIVTIAVLLTNRQDSMIWRNSISTDMTLKVIGNILNILVGDRVENFRCQKGMIKVCILFGKIPYTHRCKAI